MEPLRESVFHLLAGPKSGSEGRKRREVSAHESGHFYFKNLFESIF